jgi:glyoxylase-like metal-dependent hydrolase (beta-lactamase superfamily II)
MHMGDIAHNPVTSLQRPEWTPIFDYDPAQAIKSRRAILERVATDRVMVMGYHFPFPAIGHVVRHDSAYRWLPSGPGSGWMTLMSKLVPWE